MISAVMDLWTKLENFKVKMAFPNKHRMFQILVSFDWNNSILECRNFFVGERFHGAATAKQESQRQLTQVIGLL